MTHPSIIKTQNEIDEFMKKLLKKEAKIVGKKSINNGMFRKKL